MSRFTTFALSVLLAFAALAMVSPDGSSALETKGEPEIHYGVFSGYGAISVNPTTFVWSYEDNGTQYEIWALFRPNTSEGWVFPGPNDTDVSVSLQYETVSTPTSLADFLDWCEDQYPASMNVDKAVDFEVHQHAVTVLQ